MGAIITLLTARLAGPLAAGAALLFAGLLAWQTARIDGLPLIGGGLKAQMAELQAQAAAGELARATQQAAALAAQAQRTAAADGEARKHALASRAGEKQIQTVIERIPRDVSAKSDTACVVPWGAVRLLDAAASGADPDAVAAAVAPGQPDDAPSGVALSEAIALLATDLGIARDNADQLRHLEAAVEGLDSDK